MFMVAKTLWFQHMLNVYVAEALGLLKALECARELHGAI